MRSKESVEKKHSPPASTSVRTASDSDRIKTQLSRTTFSSGSHDPVATARGSDTIAENTGATNLPTDSWC